VLAAVQFRILCLVSCY